MSLTWVALAAAAASALAGVGSVITALFAIRLQHRWGTSDAFLRISAQFESQEFRAHRALIYSLDRDNFRTWSDAQTTAVNAWCAHLDLVAVMVQSKQLNKVGLLNMYGDVILRTVFQVAPYCNNQVGIRGKQFLLPLRLLTADLLKEWEKRARRRSYPLMIGFPAQPQLKVSPDLFESDDAVLAFRVEGKVW